jgi:hypothetical protein
VRGSRNLRRKKQLREILVKADWNALKGWARNLDNPLRALSSSLFDPDPLIKWRVIQAMGLVANMDSQKDLERVRRQIRRLLWLMNDESGGICWNAPEAIAEIVFNVTQLLGEYGKLLPSFFDEEPFEKGSRWAVARIAPLDPTICLESVERLIESLSDPDPEIRAYSAMALQAVGGTSSVDQIKTLLDDSGLINFYDFQNSQLIKTTVGQLLKDRITNDKIT